MLGGWEGCVAEHPPTRLGVGGNPDSFLSPFSNYSLCGFLAALVLTMKVIKGNDVRCKSL